MSEKKRNIVFFHPDLGIGGAERLVVDAAVALQKLGHKVTIFTSHCDPTHCFEEARDGTLDVRVRGNTIVPPSFTSRLTILCAILRQLHLIVQISLLSDELKRLNPDAFFADQLSACVPLLRYFFPKVPMLFYCHFPDKLLAYRESALKKLYRIPFDFFEEWSTNQSDVIAVNSKFTKGIFGQAFPALKWREPSVIYPCVDITPALRQADPETQLGPRQLWNGKKVILSINRFERKKDVGLAIKAFAGLTAATRQSARLVVAGGYDHRMSENVQYHQELESLATSSGLKHATAKDLESALRIPEDTSVLFLLSVPSSLKTTLLRASSLLLYTPRYEHFGIVPLEAMLERVPVLAAVTGGPPETVIDDQTGWLRDVDATREWTRVVESVLSKMTPQDIGHIGEEGRKRVVEHFSQAAMGQRLHEAIQDMCKRGRPNNGMGPVSFVFWIVLVGLVAASLNSLTLRLYA